MTMHYRQRRDDSLSVAGRVEALLLPGIMALAAIELIVFLIIKISR